jgi:hypothetical protein
MNAHYSSPGRPLQFRYGQGALECQFTLTTAGEYRGPPNSRGATLGRTSRPADSESNSASVSSRQARPRVMPPPSRPEKRRDAQSLGRRQTETTRRSTDSGDGDSLFVRQEETDRQWDPASYDNAEESLEWNTNHETVCAACRPLTRLSVLTRFRNHCSQKAFETAKQVIRRRCNPLPIPMHNRLLLTVPHSSILPRKDFPRFVCCPCSEPVIANIPKDSKTVVKKIGNIMYLALRPK